MRGDFPLCGGSPVCDTRFSSVRQGQKKETVELPMIRAVALWAGLLVVLCVGCAPAPPEPPPAVAVYHATSPVSQAATATSCSKSDFLGKVLYQETNNPVLPIPGSTPSLSGDPFPSAPDYRQDLGTAWDAASDDFRNRLCDLDVVY